MNTEINKILFIGNSLTYWNKGIDYHIKNMVNLEESELKVEVDSIVKSGANLQELWESTTAKEVIKSTKYNVIVLQEDIPETDVATFKEYVRKFWAECNRNKLRLILYMTWPYERLNWINIKEISEAHREIGEELNIEIAPVGLAWERIRKEKPELELFDVDREHPSLYGTYLATNVIFSTIYKLKPIDYLFSQEGMEISEKDRKYIQSIAWQAVEELI